MTTNPKTPDELEDEFNEALLKIVSASAESFALMAKIGDEPRRLTFYEQLPSGAYAVTVEEMVIPES